MKFLNGADAKYLLCDLSKPSSITALAKQFEGKKVQCLINNAAITPKKKQHLKKRVKNCSGV